MSNFSLELPTEEALKEEILPSVMPSTKEELMIVDAAKEKADQIMTINLDSFEEEGRLGVTTSKKTYSFSPDSKDLQLERPEEHKLILGGECTLWTEMLPHSRTAEYLLFPRFCAAAETFWLPEEKKDFEDFKERLPLHKELLHRLNYRFYEGPLE